MQEFVSWLAGISTDFYHKELIKISAKPDFSIWHRALHVRDIGNLIFECQFFALWTLIYCIPVNLSHLHATTHAPQAMPSYTYNYVMIITINIQIHFH